MGATFIFTVFLCWVVSRPISGFFGVSGKAAGMERAFIVFVAYHKRPGASRDIVPEISPFY